MKPPNVTRLESGLHIPSLDSLERVASALGLPVVDLFPRTGVAGAPSVPIASHPEVVLRGRRPVNADTALRLAHCFGTSAEFWLRLKVHHDLEQARRQPSSRLEREGRPRDRGDEGCDAGSVPSTRALSSTSAHTAQARGNDRMEV